MINNTMRAHQFINESPLNDLENRLPKIKSDQYDVDEKGKIYHNAKQASKVENMPKVCLSYNTKEAQDGHHTGRHELGSDEIWVYGNRNLIDILRTVFHELVHIRQGEKGQITPNSSYPGSPIEMEADVIAGKYIKIYGEQNHHIFQ